MNLVKFYVNDECVKRIKQEAPVTDRKIVEALWEIEDVLGIDKDQVTVERTTIK